ncbi:MAG: mandelate racemase/muconate lactonizing enzyme family protein [Rhizobacter sp.]|nr:mandelate racemase/muconate lactonizing enzyme family protein [Burkholderiales bacterium]
MPRIVKVELWQVNLAPPVPRSDAIQSFVVQETPMLRISCDDGLQGTGYSYTIGTGGSSVMALLEHHLAPKLIGRDPDDIEAIWKDLFFYTHATAVGAITALALAAIDTALWDVRCKRTQLPLHKAAGGAQERVAMYSTEGGWLHLSPEQLVRQSLEAKAQGFKGVKIKVGRPHVSEDMARLSAVRAAVGDAFEIMIDANQCFTVGEAIRRARHYERLDIAWFEEPLPAEDLAGHQRLAQSTSLPIAVGESIYSLQHFREYLQRGACSIVQADVARIGGITPWLKVAHLAESFNVPICPHFLMELHLGLCAAVPNAPWVEYIPQLDSITTSGMASDGGFAIPSDAPGLGIAWDWAAIESLALRSAVI